MVTQTGPDDRIRPAPAPAEAAEAATGWYLYGITRRAPLVEVLTEVHTASGAGTEADAARGDVPAQLLECAALAAVVRPVRLADFTPAVVQQRLRSASELEAMVRAHHDVIEAIHARQAILPARFGMVYTQERDILASLKSEQDTLLRQLDRLEACDEWAVHLYADRTAVRDQIWRTDAALRRLRQQAAGAGPGRAYFLERHLRDQLEAATREALALLAQDAFDRLAECAVVGRVNPVGAGDQDGHGEILRAAFLVTRDGVAGFRQQVRAIGETAEGLRCECTGPWPPYSFASLEDEETA